MWTCAAGHAPAVAEPPVDQGELLARFGRGRDEEFRVTASEYLGHPYVGLRLWTRGRDGTWWPSKRGCSVRPVEVGGLVDALTRFQAASRTTPADQRPVRRHRGPHRRPIEQGKPSDRRDGGSKTSREGLDPKPAPAAGPTSNWPPGPTPDQTALGGPRFDDCPPAEETAAAPPQRLVGHPGASGEVRPGAGASPDAPWE